MFSSIAPNKAMSLFLALLVLSVLECHSGGNTSDNQEQMNTLRQILCCLCCCGAKETSKERAEEDTDDSYKSYKAIFQNELDKSTLLGENLNQVDNEKS